MAGRPPAGQSQPTPNLIDFDDNQTPYYSSGARPPVNDDELLHRYDINSSDTPQPQGRPSVSYDDFVGGRPAAGLPGGPGAPPAGEGPYQVGGQRMYSQTSDLQNYQRYSDADVDDDQSMYYATTGTYDDQAGLRRGQSQKNNRNSILSMGGGLTGRVKNMLGRNPEYSEMDLPLTEHAAQQNRPNSDAFEATKAPPKKRSSGVFKFGFGRGAPDPSTLGPRIIHLNNPPSNAANKYVDNHVSTSKYNVITFLPKFLFEQFSRYANLFFLFTAILQQIPGISPTKRYTTIVPLGVVLLVSAVKEYVEDYRRKKSDQTLNSSKAQVLKGSTFTDTKWVNIAVGDIVRVESEKPFPADLVLLASSEPEGLCYIETANLDGETNLKIKQAIPETADLVSPSDLSRLGGKLRSEQPNSSLYTYEATLTIAAGGGEKELPLTPEQLLLRGATLRNTPWIHGVVVFTGHETKLMRNATAAPIKTTAVERMVNRQILMLVVILIALSIVSSVGHIIIRTTGGGENLAYLVFGKFNGAEQFFRDLLTYWVLYSNLVPISLFVTIEIVKYWTGSLIDSDLDIYYEPSDTPANCRTSSLVEELGQIEYIFSDKTGTLTQNIMEFRQSSIAGIQYADEIPEDRRATLEDGVEVGIHDFKQLEQNRTSHRNKDIIRNFLTLLATCHTVIPERGDEKGAIKYQAASPDEGALVEGAVLLGYKFVARKPRMVTIVADGREQSYELLAVCEFNSTRKRMSTIFRTPEGKIVCYTKGADTVILERLGKDNPFTEVTLTHLEEYAAEGLRTLCLAMREIPENEYQEWWKIYNAAQTTVGGNRAEELDKAAELIECNLTLLGATAIEDKLQEGVPDTIATLQSAGIKIWVLTGDRQETAINIGMSCKLISEDMSLLIVNEESKEATRENIQKKLNAINNQSQGGMEMDVLALVIDGKSLTYALERDLEKLFLELAVKCKAVICWYVLRSDPNSKTKLTRSPAEYLLFRKPLLSNSSSAI